MKAVNTYMFYVVAMFDEHYLDASYYVGVDSQAVDLGEAVYLTTNIKKAKKVRNVASAEYLAEAAAEQFSHFGRARVVSIKATLV